MFVWCVCLEVLEFLMRYSLVFMLLLVRRVKIILFLVDIFDVWGRLVRVVREGC